MDNAFARFLIDRGEITKASADRIADWALRNREPIGRIAVDHGLFVGRQIDEILDRQRHSKARFGESAAELGILGEEKLDVLLQIQEHRLAVSIIEAMALAGIKSFESGVRLLADFVKQQPELVLEPCSGSDA